MGKRLGKSEKLDLILSELSQLKGEIKKLLKHRAPAADQGVKSRSAPARRSKKVLIRSGGGKKPAREVARSKPVLVQAPQAPQPASRIASD